LGLSMTNWNTMLSLLEAFILLYLGFFNKSFKLNIPLLSKKN
jgi:disulfide bond formation protein DsbB